MTTLVVPGQNDSSGELTGIAEFIASVDRDIPWHISRFHPDYLYQDSTATPRVTLEKAFDIGQKAGLRYIYIGNVMGMSENTHCPGCGAEVIQRTGFSVTDDTVKNGACPSCGTAISGRFL